MKITQTAAFVCVLVPFFLCGCNSPQQETNVEAAATAETKGASDEVTLSTQACRPNRR